MGDVHHMNTSANTRGRLLEQWITGITSQHPNDKIAKRWTELARLTAQKFPGAPMPSHPDIDLDHLKALSSDDKEQVILEVQQFIGNYMEDVQKQVMEVHQELLALQKTVAELEARS